jgi:hypothetical protein
MKKNSWKYSAGDSLCDSIGSSDVYSNLYDVSACYRKTIKSIFLNLHSNVSRDGIQECIIFGDSDSDGDSDMAA